MASRRTALSLISTARHASTSAAPIASSSSSLTSTPTPTAAPGRIFTDRKTYLYNYYAHLLSTSQVVLLLSHDNLKVADLLKIRRAIAKVAVPSSSSAVQKQTPGEGGEPETEPEREKAQLSIIRTGVFSALSRTLDPALGEPLKSHLKGSTALLTSTSPLSPKYLSGVLGAINRTVKSLAREGAKDQVIKQPELKLLLGIMEGRSVLDVAGVEKVGKLPELGVLQSQLVGLLEMQGRQLVGVLGQAGGGGLVRTLQGLEKSLQGESEEGAGAGADKGPGA